MKKKSVKTKLAIILMIVLLIISLSSGYVIRRVIHVIIAERIENEAYIILNSIRLSLQAILENDNNADDLRLMLGSIEEYPMIGKVIYCNGERLITMSSDEEDVGKYSNNACVNDISANHSSIASMIDINKRVYEIALPVKSSKEEGILLMEMDANYIDTMLNETSSLIIFLFLGIQMGFLIMIVAILQRMVFKPLKKFESVSLAIAEQGYDIEISDDWNYEFKEMAIAYKKMLHQIKLDLEQLKADKETAVKSSDDRMAFLARMSHEIRTPLNSIIGFSSLMMEREACGDNKELEIIVNASNHLVEVVNDILDFSKTEANQLTLDYDKVAIQALFDSIYKMFELQMKSKKLDFNIKVHESVPKYIECDVLRLKEIIINLIGNALKFTNEGEITVEVNYDNHLLSVSVKDSGIGIPDDKKELIFRPFSQSDETMTRLYGGTGLGLSISKRMANMMGGDIVVLSDGKSGSEFILTIRAEATINEYDDIVNEWLEVDPDIEDIVIDYLPKLKQQLTELCDYIEDGDIEEVLSLTHRLKGVTGNLNISHVYLCLRDMEKHLRHNKEINDDVMFYVQILKRINDNIVVDDEITASVTVEKETTILDVLLAEDVEENRLLVQMVLKDYPVNIIEAENGEIAIEKLMDKSYDLLLLDIQMPIKSGLDVLKWLKDHEEHKPKHVVALSANARTEDKDLYYELGCTDYLAKPLDKKILREKISLYIAKKEKMSSTSLQ